MFDPRPKEEIKKLQHESRQQGASPRENPLGCGSILSSLKDTVSYCVCLKIYIWSIWTQYYDITKLFWMEGVQKYLLYEYYDLDMSQVCFLVLWTLFSAAMILMWVRSQSCDFCLFNFCCVFWDMFWTHLKNHIRSISFCFKLYQNCIKIVSSVSVSFFEANPPGTPEKSLRSKPWKKHTEHTEHQISNIKFISETIQGIMSKPYRNHVHHIDSVTLDHVPKSFKNI